MKNHTFVILKPNSEKRNEMKPMLARKGVF